MKLLNSSTWTCCKCGAENNTQFKRCIKCGFQVEWATYKASRTISKIISFVGWFIVVLSFLGLGMFSYYSFTNGIPVIGGGLFIGLLLVATGHITRATIDTAENTSKMLAILKSIN